MSKPFGKILFYKITDHLQANNLLFPMQFGFRNKHSTTQQVFRITSHISEGFNMNKSTLMVLLDNEKAFDTIWYKGLLYKMIKLNFDVDVIKIINSYLNNRNFFVKIKNIESVRRNIPARVPQGSLLGPILFLIYINDIPTDDRIYTALFTKDTALYISSWQAPNACRLMSKFLRKLEQYFQK